MREEGKYRSRINCSTEWLRRWGLGEFQQHGGKRLSCQLGYFGAWANSRITYIVEGRQKLAQAMRCMVDIKKFKTSISNAPYLLQVYSQGMYPRNKSLIDWLIIDWPVLTARESREVMCTCTGCISNKPDHLTAARLTPQYSVVVTQLHGYYELLWKQ